MYGRPNIHCIKFWYEVLCTHKVAAKKKKKKKLNKFGTDFLFFLSVGEFRPTYKIARPHES